MIPSPGILMIGVIMIGYQAFKRLAQVAQDTTMRRWRPTFKLVYKAQFL